MAYCSRADTAPAIDSVQHDAPSDVTPRTDWRSGCRKAAPKAAGRSISASVRPLLAARRAPRLVDSRDGTRRRCPGRVRRTVRRRADRPVQGD